MIRTSTLVWTGWIVRLFAVVAVCMCAGGCASHPRGHDYVFVTLKTGPNKEVLSDGRRKEIFEGHMANIQRLAAQGDLVVAGPFSKPADATWRGLFVLNVKDTRAAEALVQTDPGMQSGVFAAEYCELSASPALTTVVALDAKRREAPPTVPPTPGMRPYVIVIAERGAQCMDALVNSGHTGQVVWCGRFKGTTSAVIVMDASSPVPVRDWLGVESAHCSIDGWYSTDALVDLPESARNLPR